MAQQSKGVAGAVINTVVGAYLGAAYRGREGLCPLQESLLGSSQKSAPCGCVTSGRALTTRLSEVDAMARRYFTRCTVSLAVFVVTVLLQVSPAAAFASMGAVGDALASGANGYLEAQKKAPDKRIACGRRKLRTGAWN